MEVSRVPRGNIGDADEEPAINMYYYVLGEGSVSSRAVEHLYSAL